MSHSLRLSNSLNSFVYKAFTTIGLHPLSSTFRFAPLTKTGKHTELIGRVWSHVLQRSILGYKCLTLLLSDGTSQLMLDFSLHGEKGKKEDKIQGLTFRERNARFVLLRKN